MNTSKWIGIALLVAGLLALSYGSFSFTQKTQEAQIGPIELSVNETKTINIPVWAGGAAVLAGLVLLVVGGRSR
jgi:hypothetical protein